MKILIKKIGQRAGHLETIESVLEISNQNRFLRNNTQELDEEKCLSDSYRAIPYEFASDNSSQNDCYIKQTTFSHANQKQALFPTSYSHQPLVTANTKEDQVK